MSDPLLSVHSLHKRFPVRRGLLMRTVDWVHAVRGVDLAVEAGETLGLVGESGCGKTTLGRCVLRLIEPDEGQVLFGGRSLLDLDPGPLRQLRRQMQLVFQDPYTSLNPRMTVGQALAEPLVVHDLAAGSEVEDRVTTLLTQVGLAAGHANQYPHDLSGGQRQRVAVARALALDPRLLVCDEPVSALDVSVQAQILDLFVQLRQERGLTYLFISHDLAVVRHVSDRVAVMLRGTIVESCGVDELFEQPGHPYTRELMASVPGARRGGPPIRDAEPWVEGECVFRSRCPIAERRCSAEPPLVPVTDGHEVRCWLTG